MVETHKRSIVKAITWRLIAVIITTTVVYLYTKEIVLSVSIGAIDTLIKLISYYLHERMWNRLKFGRGKIEYHI